MLPGLSVGKFNDEGIKERKVEDEIEFDLNNFESLVYKAIILGLYLSFYWYLLKTELYDSWISINLKYNLLRNIYKV